jgi:[acyl-carrier-protein] S-malonyltransferase
MTKTAILFLGQGSQYITMGVSNYKKYTRVKEIFEEANDILQFDIRKICFEGPERELLQTNITQPALFVVQYAAYQVLLQEFDLTIDYYAGHSLGEISALACEGAIGFSDALKLVRARGQFMHEVVTEHQGRMAAIKGIDESTIEKICRRSSGLEGPVVIACKTSLSVKRRSIY